MASQMNFSLKQNLIIYIRDEAEPRWKYRETLCLYPIKITLTLQGNRIFHTETCPAHFSLTPMVLSQQRIKTQNPE